MLTKIDKFIRISVIEENERRNW